MDECFREPVEPAERAGRLECRPAGVGVHARFR
jgi:hypothetical protein